MGENGNQARRARDLQEADMKNLLREAHRIVSGQANTEETIKTVEGLIEALQHSLEINIVRAETERSLREALDKDSMTGALSRLAFETKAPAIFQESREAGKPLSVLHIDLNYFKRINDDHGHNIGDQVLKEFVKEVAGEHGRSSDYLFRIGGDEFVLLLPETPIDGAINVAERLRIYFEKNAILNTEGGKIGITISVGVATISEADTEFKELLERADQATLAANYNGRNRTYISKPNNEGGFELVDYTAEGSFRPTPRKRYAKATEPE